MTELKRDLPPLPDRMRALPVNHQGFPVPWFVAFINGVPDFRVVDAPKINIAVRESRCWLCGQPLGVHLAFTIGPMCAINRTIAEPPSHRECAEFSVKACPFLTKPGMRRNTKDIPGGTVDPAGEFLKRNPGATAIWMTRSYELQRVHNGVLFRLGIPTEVTWWREGRPATRAEVDASIESGLPLLRAPAEAEGAVAVRALEQYIRAAQQYLPAA